MNAIINGILNEMSEMSEKKKKIIKDVGTCLRKVNGRFIYRSKFKTTKDAQGSLDMHLALGVINPIYKLYKCPECHLWHYGLKEWAVKNG